MLGGSPSFLLLLYVVTPLMFKKHRLGGLVTVVVVDILVPASWQSAHGRTAEMTDVSRLSHLSRPY